MADGTYRHRQLTHRYFKSKANLWCGTRELGDEVGFRNFTLRFAFTSHTSFVLTHNLSAHSLRQAPPRLRPDYPILSSVLGLTRSLLERFPFR